MLLKLIFRNAFRHRLRTALTILGVAIAILSFGLLRTVIDAWYTGVNAAAPNRLVTRNAVSLVSPLPLSYEPKIRALPHVTGVSHAQWFGGVYINEKNFFATFAIADHYLDLLPEIVVPQAQKEAFMRERDAAMAGRKLVARFGWHVGQRIMLRGNIFPGNYDFVLRGIYRGGRPDTDETVFFFHFDYLNERMKEIMPQRADQAGWYLITIDDPRRAPEVAQSVDALFANSLAETLTETEKAFQAGFVSMTETIVQAIRIVSFVVIGIILIVLANTMAMSARERSGEYAVLKTLGFGSGYLYALIAGESLLIALAGGLVGIGLTFPAARLFGKAMEQFIPVFQVSPTTVVAAAAAALLVGGLASVQPAWQASRVKIVDALGRVG